jgi:hypothetical protein
MTHDPSERAAQPKRAMSARDTQNRSLRGDAGAKQLALFGFSARDDEPHDARSR